MSSILSSHAVVLTTAMVASSAMLFVAFSKQLKAFPTSHFHVHHNSEQPSKQSLRSCLYSDEKRKLKKKKKKKKKEKRVKFAEDVKEPSGNGEEYRRQHTKSLHTSREVDRNCRTETQGIPANHVALYSGILRDRVQKMQCSY